MRVESHLRAAFAAGFVCLGCAPPTQLLVVISDTDQLDATYETLDVEAVAATGEVLAGGRASLGPRRLPASFGVIPAGAANAPVSVRVVAIEGGRHHDRTIATQFRSGRRTVIYVDVSASCDEVTCTPDETCRAGRCTSVLDSSPEDAGAIVDAGTDTPDGGPRAPVEDPPLLSAEHEGGDWFGTAIAADRDATRIVVGARLYDTTLGENGGLAHVFSRMGTTWTQEATLMPTSGQAFDQFGVTVAISSDGSRVAVGAWQNLGSIRVFARTGTTWIEEAILRPSGSEMGDAFGHAVAIDAAGSRLVAGAPSDALAPGDFAGTAWVFSRSGTTWSQEAMLTAAGAPPSGFGGCVSIDDAGDLVAVGAQRAGIGRLFRRSGTVWTQEATLDGMVGESGRMAALSGDGQTLVMGFTFDPPDVSAFTFRHDGTGWTPLADPFSYSATSVGSVAVSTTATGSTVLLAIGSHVEIYDRLGPGWVERAVLTSSESSSARFGWAAALSSDGAWAFVGAPQGARGVSVFRL